MKIADRRRVPHARRRAARTRSPPTSRAGRAADRGRGDRRHDLDDEHRPGRRDRRRVRASTACGCTSTPPTAARRRSCPELRHVLDGCDRADSLVVNPHKWLLTPDRLQPALHRPARRPAGGVLARPGVPDAPDEDDVVNLMDYGRRARPPVPRRSSCGWCCAPTAPRAWRRSSPATSSWPAGSRRRSRPSRAGSCSRRCPFSTVCFRHHPAGVDDEAGLRAPTPPSSSG